MDRRGAANVTHKIKWFDSGEEPRHPPNPDYPDGIDLNLTVGGDPDRARCKIALPYPAKRFGYYEIECNACDKRVGVTTAGRPDDPRSVTILCGMRKS
jgi:hypothetical protein